MVAATLATFLLLTLLFAPLLLFLKYGWPARRRQIIDQFPDGAVSLYYRQYFPAFEAADSRADFIRDFDQRYGRWNYCGPAMLLFAVSALILWLCVHSVASLPEQKTLLAGVWPMFFISELPARQALLANFELPLLAVFCVAGAYVWVVYDFIMRERSLDFSTTHVNWASFRLAVAIPLAWVVPQLWGEEVRFAAAFFLGAFPTATLMKFLRRQAAQKVGLGETPDDLPTKLELLPSVDTVTADRFREEGITTIAQLANTDPIALTIRTGFAFNFILDCISESLSWYYLGRAGTTNVQVLSLPGALEVYGLIDELDYKSNPADPENDRNLADQKIAKDTLVVIVQKMNMDQAVVERILRSIWDDSRVEFLARLTDAIERRRSQGGDGPGEQRPAA